MSDEPLFWVTDNFFLSHLEIVSGSSLLPRIRLPGNSQWPLEIVSDLSFRDVSCFVAEFLLQPFLEARRARAEVFTWRQQVSCSVMYKVISC